MDATSSKLAKLAVHSPPSDLSFQETFVWAWYIRLKVTFPDQTDADLSGNINEISKQFDEFWQSLKSAISQEEGQIWPKPLIDNSKAYFFLIGIPTLPSPDLAKGRQLLRGWQEGVIQKKEGKFTTLEAKFIPRKVFLEHGFEIYTPPKPDVDIPETGMEEPASAKSKKEKKKKEKDAVPAAANFKKVKGSNPAEVRRQFLEHNMKASASSSSSTNTTSSGKLRPGKEVLNRMKFDDKYDIADFVVGYIDRKEGILEKSVGEWEEFGQEELMAYIKNVKSDEIVWDKARKVDLVFGRKGGG